MTPEMEDRLAAWLDGALSPEDAAAFEAELASDAELAQLAAAWRANDHLIADAFAPVAARPIEPEMLAKLGLGPDVAPAPTPAATRILPAAANDNPPWWRRHGMALRGAVAASIAALAVLLVSPRPNAPLDPLSQALDRTPSLASATLPDGRRIEPTLTVRAADGRWCREFRSGGGVDLACRGAKGWKVEAHGTGAGPAASGEIAAASGADSGGLDPAYRRLGTADPVDAKAEAALIAGNWR